MPRLLTVKDFLRVPVDQVTTPRDGAVCFVDRWWVVTQQDEVLFHKNVFPQCNRNEMIAQVIGNTFEYLFPMLTIRKLHVAYTPLSVQHAQERADRLASR